jgi:hypothetical protein
MRAAVAVPEVLEKSGRHLHNTGRGPFRSQAQFILSYQEMDIFGLQVSSYFLFMN